jgi:Plavaka transposase
MCTAEDVPWRNADALYETIDAIQVGDTPWMTYKFSYTGPKPLTPPAWMEETYELNTRDALLLLEQQIATSEFDGQVEYVTYQEFNVKEDRIYSDLMSGDWASREAVCLHILILSQCK